MLKGVSPLLGPDLLALLCRMGHGDRLVLADAHFPGHSLNNRVLRADGVSAAALLNALLPLFELDAYADAPVIMMEPVAGDEPDPAVVRDFAAALAAHAPGFDDIHYIDREAFYERARSAFGVVMTGELRKYGNLILTKGVTPRPAP